jgi:C4-dicarboxylate-specific signal transduction histidine kinase
VGVLHNVGNALNGVTAGAGLATERLGKMRLEPLERLAALLAEHRDDLPGFFAEGAAGQQVPAFVEELSRALHDDRVRLMDDLSSVKTASDHACAIVRAQQRYAKPVHVTESCNVDNVVEDALRIANIPSTIAVECTGGDVVAAVDRHRVMQIVVNLVTNAAEAIGEAPRGHIAVDVVDLVDRFEVLVADDGPGIPAEDRDRVFQFGFTTKRDGHGFGLHASSNSASEMDGRLELRHTEIGLGCQFALVLPKGKKLQRAA